MLDRIYNEDQTVHSMGLLLKVSVFTAIGFAISET